MAGTNTTLRWKRWNIQNLGFGVLVIALSIGAIFVASNTAWYGPAVLVAVGLAYLVSSSTPAFLRSAGRDPGSHLKRIVFLCAFIAIFLAVFIGRNYRVVPWPEDAASLTISEVEGVLRAYRTLLFGVCTIVAVAYLQVIRLVLRYLREERHAAGTASQTTPPFGEGTVKSQEVKA